MVQDKYQFKPALPFAPGGEISGTVSAVGVDVTDWKVGDQVAAGTGTGGFAEKVAIDAAPRRSASRRHRPHGGGRVPDDVRDLVPRAQGPGEPPARRDAARARRRRRRRAVRGRARARRWAPRSSPARRARRSSTCAGSSAPPRPSTTPRSTSRRGSRSTPAARASTSSTTRSAATCREAALRNTAWKGRFLVIGFAAGPIPRIPLNLPLLKGCSIIGVFYGEHGTRSPHEQRELVAELVEMLARRPDQPERVGPVLAGSGPPGAARADGPQGHRQSRRDPVIVVLCHRTSPRGLVR